MNDEYELVPMNPIRRMEKRVERLEQTGSGSQTTKDLIEIVKTNQKVIDEMVKMNSEMINRVSELITSVNSVTERVDNFVNRIEVAGESKQESSSEESSVENDEMTERLAKMEKRLNSLILSSMAKKIRR